ncbi:MAG: response regulator [Gammaproteobacteria bacterium]|nr:response regulator [Gammaproteobacteria bacterium]
MNAAPKSVRIQQGGSPKEQRFVLIVDDDRDFAESLQDLLGAHNYSARIASSSEEAMRVLLHFPAQVVLLDIRLGLQSGIRLLDEIRSVMPDILSVMITAYSSVETAIEALRRGAYDYLPKPVRAEVLIAALDKCFERIRLKQERDSAQRELAASESRYRQLIEDSSAVAWELDVRSWTFVYLGRQIEKLTGFPLKSWLSEGFLLKQVYNDDLDVLKKALLTEATHQREEIEIRLVVADGSLIWMRCIIDVQDAADQNVVHGYLFDITDQVNARLQQSRLQNQLQQAKRMEAIGYLTGGVAHDFNNILASVIGFTDLALERVKTGDVESVERYLQEVRNAGEKARNLVGRMLAFSRGGTGEPASIPLVETINNTLRLVQASLPKTIKLSLERSTSEVKILMDPVQLQQLLMNLCINARDAMDGPGLITLQVTDAKPYVNECASCHRSIMGEYVCLAVTDTGSGMSEELLGRVFDPFFTTKQVGQGSGLGLSIIHGIVHEYGGHILVESQPGTGTRFRILFPVLRQLADTTESEGKNSIGVVLIEDDYEIAQTYVKALQTAGYSVVHYANTTDLMTHDDVMRKMQMVIVDQSLSEISGLEFIRRLRARGLSQPMLLYTRDVNLLDDAASLQSHGVNMAIRKPELPSSLINAVGELIKDIK